MKRYLIILAILSSALVGYLSAQPTTPTLTDIQKLTLQNRVLAFQLAQAHLEAYLKELQQPGWTLDINTLTYTKDAEKK